MELIYKCGAKDGCGFSKAMEVTLQAGEGGGGVVLVRLRCQGW